MKRFLASIILFLASVGNLVAAQVRATLSPNEIFLGDAFRLEIAAQQAEIEAITPGFSGPVEIINQSRSMMNINGAVSTSYTLFVLPKELGTYTAKTIHVKLADGTTHQVTASGSVKVHELEPDPTLTLTTTVSPERAYPGDTVTCTIKVLAKEVRYKDRSFSPFVEQDWFGRMNFRLPNITFRAETDEEAPLQLISRPQVKTLPQEGEMHAWEVVITYRAMRPGEQSFAAPIVRDKRIKSIAADGSAEMEACASIGSPVVVEVLNPPTEGRPAAYTGAIATAFSVSATLDALNVKLGDPVQLSLTCKTDADPDALRPPTLPELPGFRKYGEAKRDRFEGGCTFHYSLRPLRDGLLEIPALSPAWFERTTESYRVETTDPIPLRVYPSAQVMLIGPDSEEGVLPDALPPALHLEPGPQPKLAPAEWSIYLAAFALGALVLRFLLPLVKWLILAVVVPFAGPQSGLRARLTVARATDPQTVLAAIRQWLGAPGLTSRELHTYLEPSETTDRFVQLYAKLEQALYSQRDDFTELKMELLPLLGQVKRRVEGHSTTFRSLFFLLALSLPLSLQAAPDAFLREQAEAASIAIITPQDAAEAANLWIRVAKDGDLSEAVLLNGASCALFARQPTTAGQLLRICRTLHGATPSLRRAERAVFVQQETTPPLVRLPKYATLHTAMWTVFALFCLSCAIPSKGLRRARISSGIVLVILVAAVLYATRIVNPETLPPLIDLTQLATEVAE